MRFVLIVFALTLGALCEAAAQTPEEEGAVIRALIEKHALASKSIDLEGLVELYHEDAEMVYGNGTIVTGRAAIRREYEQLVASPATQSGRHHVHPPESVRIRFFKPDLALVEVESHAIGGSNAEGAPLATSASLLITVWSKVDGTWAVSYQRSAPAPRRG